MDKARLTQRLTTNALLLACLAQCRRLVLISFACVLFIASAGAQAVSTCVGYPISFSSASGTRQVAGPLFDPQLGALVRVRLYANLSDHLEYFVSGCPSQAGTVSYSLTASVGLQFPGSHVVVCQNANSFSGQLSVPADLGCVPDCCSDLGMFGVSSSVVIPASSPDASAFIQTPGGPVSFALDYVYANSVSVGCCPQVVIVFNLLPFHTGGNFMVCYDYIPTGNTFCHGDGVDVSHSSACPCGNNGAPGHGCANSAVSGGSQLSRVGTPSPDTIVLMGSQMPAASMCVYVQGDGLADAVFGDGVLCTGGVLVRLRLKANVAGASQFPEAGDLSVSSRGQVIPGSGVRRFYQTYYRNSAAFCTAETFNITNGVVVDW